jgi:hypothetical protein
VSRYTLVLDAEQTAQLIAWTLQGRQNAYKRSIRKDAAASLESTAAAESTARAWHKQFSDPTMMPVVRCDPSPINRKRKLLQLACGHEVWSGVRRRTASCVMCAAARGAKP